MPLYGKIHSSGTAHEPRAFGLGWRVKIRSQLSPDACAFWLIWFINQSSTLPIKAENISHFVNQYQESMPVDIPIGPG